MTEAWSSETFQSERTAAVREGQASQGSRMQRGANTDLQRSRHEAFTSAGLKEQGKIVRGGETARR